MSTGMFDSIIGLPRPKSSPAGQPRRRSPHGPLWPDRHSRSHRKLRPLPLNGIAICSRLLILRLGTCAEDYRELGVAFRGGILEGVSGAVSLESLVEEAAARIGWQSDEAGLAINIGGNFEIEALLRKPTAIPQCPSEGPADPPFACALSRRGQAETSAEEDAPDCFHHSVG
jgi:hypothetical protein